MRAPMLLFALALAVPASAHARDIPYRWRNVVVGAGGFAPGILFSPGERGLAYLRTDMGGAYRWDDEAGRWIPLQDHLAESNLFGIESIALDPIRVDTVYLAAGMYGRDPAAILRSDDRGRTWSVFPVRFRMGGNEDGRGLGERLAVDPNAPDTLLFGSRHDGLQRSDDRGATWAPVSGFPRAGLGLPAGRGTNAGIAFVLFDPRPGSRTVVAASADPGGAHLFRSDDGGRRWTGVAGGPPPGLLPVKAAFDGAGRLFVAYADGIGPNGVRDGAVWRLDLDRGAWIDVTPDRRAGRPPGGYMGIATGPDGRVAVSTLNRWRPGDTVWLSRDGGARWTDLGARSTRDVGLSPFLAQGGDRADFGHWIAGLAIDPFDPGHVVYTTGATIYATRDGAAAGRLTWRPWVRGVEQTAIISLASPAAGAPLVSGFGDIAGFVHADPDRTPARMHLNPHLANTNSIDWAGRAPSLMVRSGNRHAGQPVTATLALSEDGGLSWRPLVARRAGTARQDLDGQASVAIAADGGAILVSLPNPLVSHDRGRSWTAVAGLPSRVRTVADKVDPLRFYAIDADGGRVLASRDGGRSFAPIAGAGLPADLAAARPRNRETPPALITDRDRAGTLWLRVGADLFRSRDGGARFERIGAGIAARLHTLGAAAPGAADPALYVWGAHRGVDGLYRSADGGVRWSRIDDDANRWGGRIRVIEGDPRRFGRLYVGTDGRGILYGDPAG